MSQISLNFNGKADNVISFRVDDRLNDDLKYLVKVLGRKSVADLVKEYVINEAAVMSALSVLKKPVVKDYLFPCE